jgi:YidC/Oxa1 family membrane protein insertase
MDNRRLILLCALAGIIFLMWQAWQNEFPSEPAHQQTTGQTKQHKAESPSAPAPPKAHSGEGQKSAQHNAPAPGKQTAPAQQKGPQAGATAKQTGKIITVMTDKLVAKISARGGELVQVKLRHYPVSEGHPEQKLKLLNDRPPYFFIAQSGLTSSAGQTSDANTVYRAKKSQYKLSEGADSITVPLTWQDADGRKVTKTYEFHRDSYQIGLKQQVQNGADAKPWKVGQYVQFWRTPKTSTTSPRFFRTFMGLSIYQQKGDKDDYKYRKIDFDDIEGKPLDKVQKGGWIAMMQRYFLASAIPPSHSRVRFYAKPRSLPGSDDKAYLAGFVGAQQKLAPGDQHEFKTRLFIGPELQDVLPHVAPGLDLTVDYGFFTVIARPTFWVLDKIHSVVGNWGWAIVIITLLIRLAFFKLTEAQYRSMARMRKFSPRIKQIKERYSDDREQQQKAMMDLYKKEGFNPLGGCWPLVIQFPVFIALYWVLRKSVELRQAPWILWIHDLAAPDPYYILPILYGITMFAQQKMSGSSMAMEDMQRKIMMIMPVGLAIFFTFFPSGLVLYWFVSMLVAVAQQWIINRRMEAAPAKG